MPPGPLPTPVPQLDGSPQAKVNCGPASSASLISHADRNEYVPTPSAMRAWGKMGIGPTSFADQKHAIESAQVAAQFDQLGLVAPRLTRLGYVDKETVIRVLIHAQSDVLFAIKYAIVNELPEYSSDRDFNGNHFVTACRIYEPVGADRWHRVRPRGVQRVIAHPADFWTVVIDPIADHRRPRVPQAPQLWPLQLLLTAGDAFDDRAPYDGKMPVAVIGRAPEQEVNAS